MKRVMNMSFPKFIKGTKYSVVMCINVLHSDFCFLACGYVSPTLFSM